MPSATYAALRDALRLIFPTGDIYFQEEADSRSWSRVYRVHGPLDVRVYVKGTLPSIPEAQTTVRLASTCPDLVPAVLSADLLPESGWNWFAMADAGDCAHLELTPEQACRAASILGELQRKTRLDPLFETILPACLPDRLYAIALESCTLLLERGDPDIRSRARSLYTELGQRAPVFQELAMYLAQVPSACVHGDFWPGNVAIRGAEFRIIDWGEAVWGIGGASIWNLLLSSRATLEHAAPAIWEAYEAGLQHPIGPEYIGAARTAFYVTMLVVDRHYGDLDKAESLHGMLETLERVLESLK